MILKNISYLNENFEVIFHKDIRIENNIIKEIGTDLKSFSDEEIIDGKKLIVMPGSDEEIIDGKKLIVMPGLCDGHTHIGQQLLKGKVLDADGIIWQDIMLPFESSLTDEIMKLNTKLALIEMIHAGTTSFVFATDILI